MDARHIAQQLFDKCEPILLARLLELPKRNQDAVIRRLVYLVDNIDTGPADREEIVDDAPHAERKGEARKPPP